MRITKNQLRQIIKEALEVIIKEEGSLKDYEPAPEKSKEEKTAEKWGSDETSKEDSLKDIRAKTTGDEKFDPSKKDMPVVKESDSEKEKSEERPQGLERAVDTAKHFGKKAVDKMQNVKKEKPWLAEEEKQDKPAKGSKEQIAATRKHVAGKKGLAKGKAIKHAEDKGLVYQTDLEKLKGDTASGTKRAMKEQDESLKEEHNCKAAHPGKTHKQWAAKYR